jgi:ABC-type bacteriocin/lantibiotic exporter with double-glycine peptidase domain
MDTVTKRFIRTSSIACAQLARQHGAYIAVDAIDEQIANGKLTDHDTMARYFQRSGIQLKNIKVKTKELSTKTHLYPCTAILNDGKSLILVVARKDQDTGETEVSYIDPLDPVSKIEKMDIAEFTSIWTGKVILVTPYTGHFSKDKMFDLSWFSPEFARFKWLLVLGFVISLILHLLALSPIIYIQISLDKVMGYGAMSTLYVLTAAVILALVFNGVLTYIRDYLITFISTTIESRLTGDLFDKLLDLPVEKFQPSRPDILERSVKAGASTRDFITRQLLTNIFDATAILVFLPVLYGYSPTLAFIVIGFGIFQALLGLYMTSSEQSKVSEYNKYEREKAEILRQTVVGIDSVKVFSLESRQRVQWRNAAAKSIRWYVKKTTHGNAGRAMNSVLGQVMTVAIIFTGINLALAGSMSAGAIISCNMLGGKVTGPIKQIIQFLSELKSAVGIIATISDIWNAPMERAGTGGTRVLKGNYHLTNLSVVFKEKNALNKITLEIEEGSKTGLVGPSGCGKSTLLRLFQGLVRPSSGTISVDGISFSNINIENYRSQVALVNLNPTFFNGTIEDNLRRTRPSVSERDFADALDWSGLSLIVNQFPEGLSTHLDQSGSELSSGHRMVVSIARALISNPRILLFDEVFAPLDHGLQSHVLENLNNMTRGKTFVMATHDLKFIYNYDRVIVMDAGQLNGLGTHDELLKSSKLYGKLWNLEIGLNPS